MSTESKDVAAIWQIPFECDACKGTVALNCKTTECFICKTPIDGAAAMDSFWNVLRDEKAWREWNAKQHHLYGGKAKMDTQEEIEE